MTETVTKKFDDATPVPAARGSGVASAPLQFNAGGVAGGRGASSTSLLDAVKLTVPQAAKRLGIGETKMRAVIQRGEIPVLRVGGKTVIIEQDIEIYLRGNYGRMKPVAKVPPKPKLAPLPKEVCMSPWLNKKNGTEP